MHPFAAFGLLDGRHLPFPAGTLVAVAVLAAIAEWAIGRRRGRALHDATETRVSLLVALGHLLLRPVEVLIVALPVGFVHAHAVATIDPTTPLGLAGLFFGFEFLYYWHHRLSHRLRWLWATHAVHHGSTRFNLTAAVRLGWTGAISGHFVFYLPLIFAGYSPAAVAAMGAIDLAYQFFVHTDLAPALGPLEAVLNTPRHHAVHHARDADCRDRNFGGILIVFDRLFGTFAARPERPLAFGLADGGAPATVGEAVFGEWGRLLRSLRRRLRLAAR